MHHATARIYQHHFFVNVWSGLINDQLTVPFVPNRHLTADYFLHFLQDKSPLILEDVPLRARLNMWLKHDGTSPHSGLQVMQYLNQCYHWIHLGGMHAWPPHSPDLTPLDFYFWGYMKVFF
jgi:hypothetical protein